jgi:hypothetical protein
MRPGAVGCKQDEIRAQKQRLTPQEVDRNAYRQSRKRRYAPRESKKRRPGCVSCQFLLPKQLLNGLILLTKIKAEEQAAERLQQPHGFKQRYPRTKSSFVAEALNRLLAENGLSEFCEQFGCPYLRTRPEWTICFTPARIAIDLL